MSSKFVLSGIEEDADFATVVSSALAFVATCPEGAIANISYDSNGTPISKQLTIQRDSVAEVQEFVSLLVDEPSLVIDLDEFISVKGSRGGRRWRGGRVRSR